MKARPATDPTSWRYQANIHGTFDTPSQPLWNQCEHGTDFFYSWHRMYLYYFERILRKASGNRHLTLPYWNYSDAPANRVLPLPFRDPANAGNPLFVAGRFINDGSSLPVSAVEYATAFGEIDFFDFSSSVEGTPHGAVHVQVGGLMGLVPTAANDPIFWLHHANIDRLWEGWLGWENGRANPAEPNPWLDKSFTFFDENGGQVTLTGRQILNTRKQLRYKYDDLPPAPVRVAMRAQAGATGPARVERQIARVDGLTLGSEPATVTLTLGPAQAAELAQALDATGPRRPVYLAFQGVDYDPGAYYEVFVELPGDPASAAPDSAHFAGVIAPFVDPKHRDHVLLVNVRPALVRLRGQSLLKLDAMKLTFVPRGPVPPEGKPAPPPKMRMRVAQLALVIR
jgi:tyrosinase